MIRILWCSVAGALIASSPLTGQRAAPMRAVRLRSPREASSPADQRHHPAAVPGRRAGKGVRLLRLSGVRGERDRAAGGRRADRRVRRPGRVAGGLLRQRSHRPGAHPARGQAAAPAHARPRTAARPRPSRCRAPRRGDRADRPPPRGSSSPPEACLTRLVSDLDPPLRHPEACSPAASHPCHRAACHHPSHPHLLRKPHADHPVRHTRACAKACRKTLQDGGSVRVLPRSVP